MMRDDHQPARSPSRRRFIGGAGAVALGAASALAATPGTAHAEPGPYEAFWSNPPDATEMTTHPDGGYSLRWQNASLLCGRGWPTGSRRTANWAGSFDAVGIAFLAIYGWTSNPLVEYRIVENYASYRPTGEARGSVTTDGATYDLYQTMRYNAPSVEGTQTFPQYWSVCQSRRTGGTVTTGNHFDAWAEAGMNLGEFAYYMIFAVEGYQSTGSASLSLDW